MHRPTKVESLPRWPGWPLRTPHRSLSRNRYSLARCQSASKCLRCPLLIARPAQVALATKTLIMCERAPSVLLPSPYLRRSLVTFILGFRSKGSVRSSDALVFPRDGDAPVKWQKLSHANLDNTEINTLIMKIINRRIASNRKEK